MSPAPGSFLWLLCNDVRLNWRRFAGMLGRAGRAGPWLIAAAAIIVSHLIAWPVAKWLGPVVDRWPQGQGGASGPAAMAGLLAGMFCWMVAQSLFGTMRTLYDRGDLDLLMGSPLPATNIFGSKALAIVLSTIGSVAVLVLPLANMGALTGRPQWLAAYPTLLAFSLIATAIALLLAIGLFFQLGARRARLVMQLAGAAIGGGLVLAGQIVLLLPDRLQSAVLVWIAGLGASAGPWTVVVSVPVAAARGDVAAIITLLAVAAALFAIAVVLLSERFARASLAAAGAGSEPSTRAARQRHFRTGPAPALRRKEWRLLLRDPGLFAQVSLQIIYTIPLMIVLLKSGTISAGIAIAPSLVVIVAQVAASLAWISVSGEDAPELLASAPIAPQAIDRAKLTAIAAPVLALLALATVPLALISPMAAAAAILFASGASISTALLNIWHPMPGNRRGMLRRHSQSKVLALMEHIIAVLWAVATVLLLLETLLFPLPIALACGVLALAAPGRPDWIARARRAIQRRPKHSLEAAV